MLGIRRRFRQLLIQIIKDELHKQDEESLELQELEGILQQVQNHIQLVEKKLSQVEQKNPEKVRSLVGSKVASSVQIVSQTCQKDGCDAPHYRDGLCLYHYNLMVMKLKE